MHPFLFGYDFYYLWSVGALLHQGSNPYDLVLLQGQLDALGWPPYEAPQKFTHAVTSLWVYWLVATMPFVASLTVWSFLSLLVIGVCAFLLASALDGPQRVSRGLVVFSAALFPATLGNLLFGQMNALLLLGITLFALRWRHERYFEAGLFLSLSLIKPHNFVPFILVVFLNELRNLRVSCILGCGLGLALQLGASYLIAPQSITWYQAAMTGILDESLRICGATLGQLVECSSNVRFLRPGLLLGGTLLSFLLVRRRGYCLSTLLGGVLPLSVCVSPYSWMHSFVVLIPSVTCLLVHFGSRVHESVLLYVVCGFGAVSIPLVVSGYQAAWVLLAWAVFAASLFLPTGSQANLPRRGGRTTA